jgi:hypothetical protein
MDTKGRYTDFPAIVAGEAASTAPAGRDAAGKTVNPFNPLYARGMVENIAPPCLPFTYGGFSPVCGDYSFPSRLWDSVYCASAAVASKATGDGAGQPAITSVSPFMSCEAGYPYLPPAGASGRQAGSAAIGLCGDSPSVHTSSRLRGYVTNGVSHSAPGNRLLPVLLRRARFMPGPQRISSSGRAYADPVRLIASFIRSASCTGKRPLSGILWSRTVSGTGLPGSPSGKGSSYACITGGWYFGAGV